MKFVFKLKKAAMFGIDARVTLVVMSIVAFMVGINQFTDIGQSNKKSAGLDLRSIKTAMLNYYEDNYSLPASVDVLLDDKYLGFIQEDNIDPWGTSYAIESITNNEIIDGVSTTVQYIMLLSYGKNGVKDTSAFTNKSNWTTMQASGDDIILKFSTIDIDNKIIEEENNQLTIIQSALNEYVKAQTLRRLNYCNQEGKQLLDRCDLNQDGVYEESEELGINMMLKDIDDDKSIYRYVTNITYGGEAEFKSGYIKSDHAANNMYSFLSQIGVSSIFATSSRGYTLHFTSNKYGSTTAPYFAEIWYDVEQTVF